MLWLMQKLWINEMENRNRKLKKEKKVERIELDCDDNFAFIAGYTSGGVPYGLTHEEMAELEKENNKTENTK